MLESLSTGKTLGNSHLEKTMAQTNDITVFITTGDATCADCGEDLGRHALSLIHI